MREAGRGGRAATALRSWAQPVGMWLASRAIVLVAFGATTTAQVSRTDPPWPEVATGSRLLRALTAWDGGWYVDLAHNGYPASVTDPDAARIAFFPLFPLVVRAVSAITPLSTAVAAVVVATLAGGVAVVVIRALVERLSGRVAADRTVALVCFFPGSLVLSMAYSEGLMLACTAACLLFLVDRRWVLAGVAGGLATATRPNALVLVACCGWAALAALRRDRDWRSLAAPLLCPAGTAAYFAFLRARTGSWTAWFDVQRDVWQERVGPGASLRFVGDALDGPVVRFRHLTDVNALVVTIGLAVTVMLLVALARWRPPAVVTLYALGIVALAFSTRTLGLRPRFVLTAFPLLAALAAIERDDVHAAVVGCSAVALGVLVFVTVNAGAATP